MLKLSPGQLPHLFTKQFSVFQCAIYSDGAYSAPSHSDSYIHQDSVHTGMFLVTIRVSPIPLDPTDYRLDWSRAA